MRLGFHKSWASALIQEVLLSAWDSSLGFMQVALSGDQVTSGGQGAGKGSHYPLASFPGTPGCLTAGKREVALLSCPPQRHKISASPPKPANTPLPGTHFVFPARGCVRCPLAAAPRRGRTREAGVSSASPVNHRSLRRHFLLSCLSSLPPKHKGCFDVLSLLPVIFLSPPARLMGPSSLMD